MSFSNMLEILQEKNKNKVVLIKLGIFYIATGKDAIFLNKELKLKCICFKKEVCKVGIPESKIEDYTKKLNEKNIAYIVYDFDGKNQNLVEKYKNDGIYHKEEKNCNDCVACKETRSCDNDKYMNAIKKLLNSEEQ